MRLADRKGNGVPRALPYGHRRTLVIALSIAVASSMASCSLEDALAGGKVSFSSYPPVTVTTTATRPGSPSPPTNFPREIPVIGGLYSSDPSPFGDAKAITVTVKNSDPASAVEEARKLLVKAEYQPIDMQGTTVYISGKFAVLLTDDRSNGGVQVHYVAIPVGALAGMPQIPTLTIPTFLPAPSSSAADPQR